MNGPFVSVIVCTAGHRDLIKCIDSVLASSYKNFELIVVDDGSGVKLKENGFKIVRQNHKGLTPSRNAGIKNSSGSIIAFIDDDAVAEKNWISALVASFDSGADAVGGKTIEYFFGKTEENLVWTCNNFGLIKVNPEKTEKNDFVVLHGCNMAFSRTALEAVNFFDENFNYYYDEIDISFRLKKKGLKIMFNPDAVVHHFINQNMRFGNKFEFGKFKYYFCLKNFNSFFYFLFLLAMDFPFAFNDVKNSFVLFLKKELSFSALIRDVFFVFGGRLSGTRKAFIDFFL